MKKKYSMQTIMRYLRDFSIVVAGIAVTLYVNDRVTNQGEKRDLKLYLNAIKIELEENIKEIDKAKDYIQREINYSNYLKTHDKKSREIDSLAYYANNGGVVVQKFIYKSNAFDMFKSSGVMRLLDDKEFMLAIWEAYEDLSGLTMSLDWIAQYKWEKIKIEIPSFADGNKKVEDLLNSPIMYNYYIFDINSGLLNSLEEVQNKIRETVEKLEKMR